MPIIGWIRDLFGIRKDVYETKKTRLEIEKIEEEKREKLITPATLEDVKKYDSKTRKLISHIEGDSPMQVLWLPMLMVVAISIFLALLKMFAPEVYATWGERIREAFSR